MDHAVWPIGWIQLIRYDDWNLDKLRSRDQRKRDGLGVGQADIGWSRITEAVLHCRAEHHRFAIRGILVVSENFISENVIAVDSAEEVIAGPRSQRDPQPVQPRLR